MSDSPLAGVTIGITADRRWEEQADLFTRRGAAILHGPTLRTVELSADERLRAVTEALIERPPDYAVITTGMGLRLWLAAATGWGLADTLLGALARGRVLARGAKSASAARGAGLDVWWQAPAERMDDVVARLEQAGIGASRVALQLFDPTGHPSTEALRRLAGDLVEVPVYRWLLPDDPEPALQLVEAIAHARVGAVTFTAQPAVHHLLRLAETRGREGAIRDALNGPVLTACVGPVCAEAAVEEGLRSPVWPEPARLPAMVRLVADRLGRGG